MDFFCTLFDSFYLSRGLALYNSLKQKSLNFHLYIFPFDESCLNILLQLDLEHATIIPLGSLETDELKSVKKKRTRAEYCWTCSPQIVDYTMRNFKVDMVTYLDADICFFDSPSILLDQIRFREDRDVLLTEHNFYKDYETWAQVGKYCVQFVTFKNSENAKKILSWWKTSCLNWCYARLEDDKYGDQKYLEKFEMLFQNVFVTELIGAGVAPWNCKKFKLFENKLIENKNAQSPIFYHFQGLKISKSAKVMTSHLYIPSDFIEFFYYPYLKEIFKINCILQTRFGVSSGMIDKISFLMLVKYVLRNLRYDVILKFKTNSKNLRHLLNSLAPGILAPIQLFRKNIFYFKN